MTKLPMISAISAAITPTDDVGPGILTKDQMRNMKALRIKKPFSWVEFAQATFHYAWLVVTCLIVLIPLAWMIWASLSKGKLVTGVSLFPNAENFSWEHYEYLFTYSSTGKAGAIPDFVGAFMRTFQLALLNMVVVVVLSVMVGYAVSRFRFKGKKPVMYGMLILQLFPSFMGMMAFLVFFRDMRWLNNANYFTLIYAAGSIPLNVFMIRGFMRNIPMSLDEAASIDGASKTKTFLLILLPLCLPIIGFVAVNAFMAPWMDYILPSVLLDKKSETLAVLLYRWTDRLVTLTYNPLNFMAGGLVVGIPIMVIQFYMQRFIMYGVTSGADKG